MVGLAAKNAILIVEFANEIRNRGTRIREAAIEAARERFRPDSHDVVRLHPRRVAAGDRERAGAGSRHSLGTGVFAGMLFATTVGIFFIPLFFRVIRGLAEGGAPGAPRAPRAVAFAGVAGGAMIRRVRRCSCRRRGGLCGRAQLSSRSRSFPRRRRSAPRSRVPAPARSSTPWRRPGQRHGVRHAAPPAARAVLPDSLPSLAWLDIFRDSTMLGLVRTALAQNRDLQTAISRIREFRADVGIARAPLFPSMTANGSVSTNQVAIGSFPPTQYDALRVTGGRGLGAGLLGPHPAGDRGRQGRSRPRSEASQRAVVLSLVSDVAHSAICHWWSWTRSERSRERTLASRTATLELARRRFQQGLTSELDVRQFEAQVAVPAAALAATERFRAQQEHALSLLLGQAPAPIARRKRSRGDSERSQGAGLASCRSAHPAA